MDLIFQIIKLFYCLYVFLCRNTSMKVTLKNRINRFSTALVIVGDFRDDQTILDNTFLSYKRMHGRNNSLFLFKLTLKRVSSCIVFRP